MTTRKQTGSTVLVAALAAGLLLGPVPGLSAPAAAATDIGRLKICVKGAGARVWGDGPSFMVKRLRAGKCATWLVLAGPYQVGFQNTTSDCEVALERAVVTRDRKSRTSEFLPVFTNVGPGGHTRVNFTFGCA